MKPDKMERREVRHGFRDGFHDGRRDGVQAGRKQFGSGFQGTSIIIPTCNQRHSLKKCIRSIMENTDLPYEIIVVDNASTDRTSDYLQQLGGQVRYRVLDTNRGFPGAANVGLMMAKGRTLLLLSSETLVTPNWLENMLRCLDSDAHIGMVGPVTNTNLGDHQQIPVPHHKTSDMPAFAKEYNQPDPKRWRWSDRLTGFCLLFRRELFEALGYFDERFEIGSYEEEDYQVRARLLGKSLVIAGDTVIHHYGGLSSEVLDDPFQAKKHMNELIFIQKWNNPYRWIDYSRQLPAFKQKEPLHSAAYYPERIAVQGKGPAVYWIMNGQRRPIRGMLSFPVIRVSQVDLRRWPVGEPIDSEVPELEWRGMDSNDKQGSSVIVLPDDSLYHLEGSTIRPIVSQSAFTSWNLHQKKQKPLFAEALMQWETGLPIIAAPQLRQPL